MLRNHAGRGKSVLHSQFITPREYAMHTFVHLGKKKREEREMGRIHSVETFGTVDGPGSALCRVFSGMSDALSVLSQS